MADQKRPFLETGLGVVLIAILCNLLWGSAIPFINLGYRCFAVESADTPSQILFAGVRFMMAGALTVLICSVIRRRLALPKKGGFHRVAALAMTQTVTQYFLFYVSLAHTEAVKSSIIQGLNSFVVILVACYLFHTERMTRRKALGGLLGIGSVFAVQLNGHGVSADFSLMGEGAMLLSLVANATSASLIKRFGREDDPMALSGWQFMLGGCIMAAVGFRFDGRLVPESPLGVLVLLYLAALSATAYSLWALLLSVHPVSRIAAYMVLQPIFGVLLTMLLTRGATPLSPLRIALALALVSGSILLITTDRKQAEAPR